MARGTRARIDKRNLSVVKSSSPFFFPLFFLSFFFPSEKKIDPRGGERPLPNDLSTDVTRGKNERNHTEAWLWEELAPQAHFQELKSTRIERGDPLVQGDFRWRNRSHWTKNDGNYWARKMMLERNSETFFTFYRMKNFENKENEKNFWKNETWYFLIIFFISFEMLRAERK